MDSLTEEKALELVSQSIELKIENARLEEKVKGQAEIINLQDAVITDYAKLVDKLVAKIPNPLPTTQFSDLYNAVTTPNPGA